MHRYRGWPLRPLKVYMRSPQTPQCMMPRSSDVPSRRFSPGLARRFSSSWSACQVSVSRIGGRLTKGSPSVRRIGFPSSITWPSSCGLPSRLRSVVVYHCLESLRLPVVWREVWPGDGTPSWLRSLMICMSESLARTRSTIRLIVLASSSLTARTLHAPWGLRTTMYPYGTLPPV
jgi:hypothetical protein